MAGSRVAKSRSNRILGALSPVVQRQVGAVAQEVRLAGGDLVCRQGRQVSHVYFPRHGVISLYARSDGADVGVGLIGGEGMFGLAAVAGGPVSSLQAVAQGEVVADRIEATQFRELLAVSPGFTYALMGYGVGFAEQMGRNVACVTRHPALQRLARWLLDVSSNQSDGSLVATQAAMASALGIQRPAVSHAASELQRLGLINYVRGAVTILDRRALEARSCGCTRPFDPKRAYVR